MADLIDTVEDHTPPSLAFIGYLDAILADDIDAMNVYESTFGRNYMGLGGASLLLTAIASTIDDPGMVLASMQYEFGGRTLSPHRRASQRFIDDVIDSMFGYGSMAKKETSEESFSTTIDLTFGRVRRVTYMRAVASVVLSALFMIEDMTQTPLDRIMTGLRVVYLSHADD